MTLDLPGARNLGNLADYILGTAEGWDAFGVVRWHGIEELSQPYRYDITLSRAAALGPVDLDGLLDADASFRIASAFGWRVIHGILAEAEEVDRTSQLILYRVLLVPHFWRARYRRRCRNFLDKSLVDIVSAVLENRSPVHPEGTGGLLSSGGAQPPPTDPDFSSFQPATATYRWDLKDPGRAQDRMTVRPYVAQYNESDFDFVARLLEDEGLTYYFEHAGDQVVLAITDRPGVSPLFDPSSTFVMRRRSVAGAGQRQEIVRSLRDTRRLRSRAVTVRDWDYQRSGGPLEARQEEGGFDPELCTHFEFPVGEENIGGNPGQHAAAIRKERYDAERALREGSSSVRTMATGYRFMIQDGDSVNPDSELLAVRVETFATELAPEGTLLDEEPFGFANTPRAVTAGFESRFTALPAESRFRPSMRTQRPRIHGVQAAVVTAEEYADGDRPVINGDELGRVRVRFPWDQRGDINDQTPTSDWIRVSQYWAGAGYGALYMPRVGHEVLVAYHQGDPDRPVIVGRVYNAQHPPPYDAKKEPTKTTLKSQSAEVKKEVDGFNELRFDDRAKNEEIYLHAQRNLNEVVIADHATGVGGNQSNGVGMNQSNAVQGHRDHTVGDFENVTIGGDRTTLFKANEHHTVAAFRDTTIGANETLKVGGFRSSAIGANETLTVASFRSTTIGANDDLAIGGWYNVKVNGGSTLMVGGKRDVTVGGGYTVVTTGDYKSEATANHVFKSTNTYVYPSGDFQVDSTTAGFNQGDSFYIKAGSASLEMRSGFIVLNNGAGSVIAMNGGLIVINAASQILDRTGGIMQHSSGGAMLLQAGGDMSAIAPTIHLNG